ncbi:MAG: AAA family ATPase [Chloroflexi bacterium]|nr:AAA family ATPase [Chloroflexota bacterium]MBP8057517.1 AAA family ATPase [Chloroflexota bacterium]
MSQLTHYELSQKHAYEDLQTLLAVLPDSIQNAIRQAGQENNLLEIVLDLGRLPSARYVEGEIILRPEEVTTREIEQVVNNIGDFDDDNRAGIARTLHRISGIRNRKGAVVGLTCRVARAVYGTIDIMADIVEEGHSILLLGRPGVGKTTMLREMARVLAEKKRVIIVDTSNEIGGDGDIPHPAVGKARRMQVPRPSHQDETMIEAVENHNPEVIVIDEIGREKEAAAARTINERGVQLIGTAHGRTLENLLLNPTLSDLIGGIESVTLSDEEARRRGTQKTVLERRSPPTFDILIEIQDRQKLVVHRDVAAAVDEMLRQRPLTVELRSRDEEGQIHIEQQESYYWTPGATSRRESRENRELRGQRGEGRERVVNGGNGRPVPVAVEGNNRNYAAAAARSEPVALSTDRPPVKLYPYGVARNRLIQAARRLRVPLEIVDDLTQANMLVTLKSLYRKRRQLISDAERRRVSVYVLRANTNSQIDSFLADAFNLENVIPSNDDPFESAIAEAQRAIEMIHSGQQSVDLAPVNPSLRRYQHQMARQANLVSHSYGREPNRHVRIFSTPRNEANASMGE